MNRINNSKTFILLTVVLCFFASCQRELDKAPVAIYEGKATHTIAELLEFHPLTSGFTYDTLPKGVVIQGTVISSDEEGNCYKYIAIDDGTAAVQVKINSSTLYPNYPLGQHVYVECDGLILGDYGLMYQLGWWENDEIQGISVNKLYKYVYKDGIPGPNPEPTIELTSANQIQGNMYGRLVRLKNVHFTTPGQVFAGTTSSGTENEISFEDGTKIILYTSMYAKFASQLTPAGVFDMTAILSRFRTTNQLVIRSLKDIGTPVIPPTYTEVPVYTMDVSQNPLDNGWLNQTNSGSSWEYMSGTAMRIVGAVGANDSWLISPSINASSYDNMRVTFVHRSLNGTSNRHVYYSTNYTGGDVQNAVWTPLNVNNYTTTFETYTQELPAEVLSSSNLRFAFRYQDNIQSTWLLKEFKLVSIVEQ